MADTTLRLLNRFSHGMISSGINMPESLRLNSNLPSKVDFRPGVDLEGSAWLS